MRPSTLACLASLTCFALVGATAACGGSSSTPLSAPDGGSGSSGGGSGSSGASSGGGSGSGSGGTGSSSGGTGSGSGGTGSGSGGTGSSSGGTGDGGTGDGGTPFNVANVSGLSLWLDAAKGLTLTSGVVSAWADQSPNMNNAAESRAALQPSLDAAGIHGLPAVKFSANPTAASGNDLIINASATLGFGAGDFLIALVGQYDNAPGVGAAEQLDGYGEFYTSIFGAPIDNATGLGLYGNAPPIGGNAASTSAFGFVTGTKGVASANTGYNDGKAHLFVLRRAGTTLALRVDANEDTLTITANTDVGSPSGAHLGGIENAAAQRLDGEIAEVIAVKGALAMGDLAGIVGYLKSKYGL